LAPVMASELSQADDGDCAVCLTSLTEAVGGIGEYNVVRLQHCKHLFHHACITSWLKKSQSCPMCRAAII
jgi:hypothetical protein